MNYIAIYKLNGKFICKCELGWCADIYEASRKASISPAGSLSAAANGVALMPSVDYNERHE